jgi:hypothetical protein
MPDRRLTRRTWTAAIVAFGALFAWVHEQGSGSQALAQASHSIIAWGLSFLAAFGFARWSGLAIRPFGVRTLASVVRTLLVVAALYLAFAHFRARNLILLDPDHGFPYPDRPIIRLERWFDARRPAPAGSLKLHGEFPLVAFILGALVILLSGGSGLLSGLLTNRPRGAARQPIDCLEA